MLLNITDKKYQFVTETKKIAVVTQRHFAKLMEYEVCLGHPSVTDLMEPDSGGYFPLPSEKFLSPVLTELFNFYPAIIMLPQWLRGVTLNSQRIFANEETNKILLN